MQVIAQQGTKTGARKLGQAAIHDLRMYSEKMRENLQSEAKILMDPERTKLNRYIFFTNEFSKWFREEVKPALQKIRKIEDPVEFNSKQKKVTKIIEDALMGKVKEYFKKKKQQGLVKKNRGWQSKRASYNMVISMDRELKGQIVLGNIKEEDAINAMIKAYEHIANEIGINTIYVAVHRDETTPHLHVMAANVCKDGKALTGHIKMMKSKPYQISFPEFTDMINKYAEEELIKMGYNIHLQASHRNKTGKHKDVKTLRREYIEQLESKVQQMREENEMLKRKLQMQVITETGVQQAKQHIKEVKAWQQAQTKQR